MAIPLENSFVYKATATSDSFRPGEIVLQGRECSALPGPWPLGPEPKITVGQERIVLSADTPQDAREWYVSLSAGDVLPRVLRPGDILKIVRTMTPGYAVSIYRDGGFFLAIGSVMSVDLGPEVRMTHGPPFDHSLAPQQGDAWLEFEVSGERQRLHEREVAHIRGYRAYVERVPWINLGTEECAAVAHLDDETVWIAAVRSTILLAHGELKVGDWSFFSKIE